GRDSSAAPSWSRRSWGHPPVPGMGRTGARLVWTVHFTINVARDSAPGVFRPADLRRYVVYFTTVRMLYTARRGHHCMDRAAAAQEASTAAPAIDFPQAGGYAGTWVDRRVSLVRGRDPRS